MRLSERQAYASESGCHRFGQQWIPIRRLLYFDDWCFETFSAKFNYLMGRLLHQMARVTRLSFWRSRSYWYRQLVSLHRFCLLPHFFTLCRATGVSWKTWAATSQRFALRQIPLCNILSLLVSRFRTLSWSWKFGKRQCQLMEYGSELVCLAFDFQIQEGKRRSNCICHERR